MHKTEAHECLKEIPLYNTFSGIRPIAKGMSGDKKYLINTAKGQRLLLRTADISQFDRKKDEFEIMGQVKDLGVPMPSPIDFGVCSAGNSTYTLLTWIDGREIDLVLPELPACRQYEIGFEAGEILHKIHELPVKACHDDWFCRYFSVIDERLDAFLVRGVPFEGDKVVLGYLNENRCLLKNRPQCHHHGDYHMGNLILKADGHLSVIDWHTVDFENYGDPWYELNRIAVEYPAFASGQIDGYFRRNIPGSFWPLFAYYLSASAITSVVWTKRFLPENMAAILGLNLNILNWFDNMKTPIPTWYRAGGF